MTRYQRQERFAPLGPDGQARLAAGRVMVLGCGALGSAVAETLGRAGVGFLRLIDRDVVELSNLHRQSLFTEADVAACLPKAEAVRRHLSAIDASLRLEAVIAQVDARNICTLCDGVDLVVDGTDTFRTRHLLNQECCRRKLPWIHGAVLGAYGLSFTIIPGQTPCLGCLQDQIPGAGEAPTCASAGVIAPAVHLVAAWQSAEAIKLLAGRPAALRRELWTCDLWANTFQKLDVSTWRDPACRACGAQADRPLLAETPESTTALCGDAVQILRPALRDLAAFSRGLGPALVTANTHLVRWHDGDGVITLFADGRALVQGIADPRQAQARLDRWLG